MENNSSKLSTFTKIYITVITLITIAAIGGGLYIHTNETKSRFDAKPDKIASDNYDITEDITSLVIDVDITDLSIEYGPDAKVEYHYTNYDAPTIDISKGKLSIKQKNIKKITDVNNFKGDCELEITLPDNTKLSNFELSVDCGNVDIRDINADKIEIEADLGNVELKNISSQFFSVDADCGNVEIDNSSLGNTVEIDASLGNIELTKTDFKSADLQADMGAISVSGDFDELKASCDFGAIDIKSKKSENDIKLDLNTDLGSITVNGHDWK